MAEQLPEQRTALPPMHHYLVDEQDARSARRTVRTEWLVCATAHLPPYIQRHLLLALLLSLIAHADQPNYWRYLLYALLAR